MLVFRGRLTAAGRQHRPAAAAMGVAQRQSPAAPVAAVPPPCEWNHQVQRYLEAAMGPAEVAVMQAALAVPPLHTCLRVNTLRTTPQEVMTQLQELLAEPPSTSTSATATADNSDSNGSGHTNTSSSRYGISVHPQLPAAVLLEGSGPHPVDLSTVSKQVLISRKAGEAVLRGAHAFIPGVLGCSGGVAAGDTVALMVDLGGAQGQSSTTRGATLPLLGQQQHPTATDTDTMQQQPSQEQPQWLCAGIGRAAVGRVDMFRLQHGVAVELTQRLYDVPSLNGQLQGLVMLQNLPSIVAAQVLNPPPGSRVLDMCAAPGGKTTALAQLMGCKGQVFALDRSHAKVDDIRSLAEELGCSSCITAIKMDATRAVAAVGEAEGGTQQELEQQQQQQEVVVEQQAQPQEVVEQQQPQQEPQQQQQQQQQQQESQDQQTQPLQLIQQQLQQHQVPLPQGMSAKAQLRLSRRLAAMAARGHKPKPKEFRSAGSAPAVPKFPGFAPESFSHVLLDAPCTALGLRPKLQQPLSLPDLLDAAVYQRQLLAAAVQLVQPGGFLVYSTCSISPAENELNVRHALDAYPCLKLVPSDPIVGGPGLKGPADAAAFAEVLAEAAAAASGGGGDGSSNSNGGAKKSSAAAAVVLLAEEAARLVDSGTDSWLSEQEARMVQRFYPQTGQWQRDTIGFFVAKFEKVASTQ